MVFRLYGRLLARRPLLTQMLTAGTLSGTGDLISQFCVERKTWEQYDPRRTARFFGLGSCFVAPILHRWFRILEMIPGNPKFVPLLRVAIDQLCFAPVMVGGFLISLRILEGHEPLASALKAKEEILPIMLVGWKVWPPAQLINFYLIPLQYRILWVQSIALFWNTFLAYKTQCQQPSDQRPHVPSPGRVEFDEIVPYIEVPT